MARKDKGSEDETPEPVVSKGTAGEGIDDLSIPSDDEIEPTEDTVTGADSASETDTAADDDTASADGVVAADDAAAVDVNDPGAEVTAGEDSADDLGLAEVPVELAEDTPAPEELPETGLVSEFVDVGKRQASWLVSNRESSTALRSPYFLVTGAVIILGILAAIITGLVGASDKTSGTPSMAMVGVGEQAAMYEQQLGVKITDADDAESAEKLVREGKVDAAFIQDPSGQGQPTIIALDKQPEALLEKLAPETKATLLNAPAVEDTIATPVLWGMVAFSLLVIATLGTALYQNLRLEKRNRITEIIAATIPPRASASGRITGTISLVVVHLVVAAVITELGLSLSGKTELAFNMLPGLGWFALALLFTAWAVFALLVWASTAVGAKARTTFLSIIGVITVAGLFAPMFVGATGTVAKVLSWVPFTSPLGIAGRFFAGQAEWWEGLVAAAIAAVLAFILHSLASGAYVRSVLTGGGRAGKKVKMSKRAKKVAAGSADSKEDKASSAKAVESDSTADSADADDSDDANDANAADSTVASADDVETDPARATAAKVTAAKAEKVGNSETDAADAGQSKNRAAKTSKDSKDSKLTKDAKSADDSGDEK